MTEEPSSFEWMIQRGTTPPPALMSKSTVTFNGETQAMTFIKHVGIPFIPKQFWHDPSLQNPEGNTVAMIATSLHIPVIYELWHHDPSLQNNDGNTVAMIAIMNGFNIEPWMQHNPNLQNNDGNTIAMLFIQKELSDPPKWMQHDPDLQDKNGNTIAMLYVAVFKDDPLHWMQGNPYIRNIKGATIRDVWMNMIKTPPPEWMKEIPYVSATHICKCCGEKVMPKWLDKNTLLCDECAKEGKEKKGMKRVYVDSLECAICRTRLKNIVVMKKCGHVFCKSCVDSWIKTSNTCPFGCKLIDD